MLSHEIATYFEKEDAERDSKDRKILVMAGPNRRERRASKRGKTPQFIIRGLGWVAPFLTRSESKEKVQVSEVKHVEDA